MVRLKDILIEAATKRVSINGQDIVLRELTPAELDALLVAMPEPQPPMEVDLRLGTNSPPQPNERDPGYIAKHREWGSRILAGELAVSMGAVVGSAGAAYPGIAVPDAFTAWLTLAVAELMAMPQSVFARLSKAFNSIGEEDPLGNSCAPPARAGKSESPASPSGTSPPSSTSSSGSASDSGSTRSRRSTR